MGRGVWAVVLAVVCAAGLSVQAVRAADPPPKEVGIRGLVERGAAEGSYVIKVAFGQKKVIAYEVPQDCPKAKEFAALVGKVVEAKGVMKKGPGGENLFVVSDCAESVKAR